MSEKSIAHWTDDEELLSKFVLHQLSAAEETRLSSHLRSCTRCQLAVDDEVRVVAGVRHAGRLNLKRQLGSRLARGKQHAAAAVPRRISVGSIPWSRVASLAAVLAILIAVGVYNNWFGSNYRNSITQHEIVQEQPIRPGEPEKKQVPSTELELDKTIGQSNRVNEEAGSHTKSMVRVEPLKGKSEAYSPGKDEDLRQSITASPTQNSRDEIAVGNSRKSEYQVNLSDQAYSSAEQGFWVEGRIISAEGTNSGAVNNGPSVERQDQMGVAAAPQSGLKKEHEQLLRNRVQQTPIEFSLDQRPLSSLPQSFQNRQMQGAGTVQTLIKNSDDTVQLTLYLESPLPDSELRTADVRIVGDDSLVLSLPNKQIGYRLPPAIQNQVNMKLRRQ